MNKINITLEKKVYNNNNRIDVVLKNKIHR